MKERLQKILAQAGVCSRRAAETMIEEGRVTVGGRRAKLGDKADPVHDRICVDKQVIGRAEAKKYIMLNKPRGYITTLKDEDNRKDVSLLVADCGARVYPVGRLDYNSEGLLILTNDGDLAYSLTHPSHEVNKKYLVSIKGDIKKIPQLSKAMVIDGYKIKPAEVEVVREGEDTAAIHMIIHEGRNRQIRKMCEQCGLEVRRLKREAIGDLKLDNSLPIGKWRELTEEEVEILKGNPKEEVEKVLKPRDKNFKGKNTKPKRK